MPADELHPIDSKNKCQKKGSKRSRCPSVTEHVNVATNRINQKVKKIFLRFVIG